MTFTFAVVGHDEAPTLPGVLNMALLASRSGDEVWFVDSASADDSAVIAASLGATVVSAPIGKGRAIATALRRCRTSRIAFLDADVRSADPDVVLLLRDAAERADGMVVGQLAAPEAPMLYRRLTDTLFPEVPYLRHPLSGFRVLDAGRDRGVIPPGFGVEAHLNIEAVVAGEPITTVEIGSLLDAARDAGHVPAVAADVAEAILDLAELHGRLAAGSREAWNGWVAELLEGVEGGLRRPLPALGGTAAAR